ncbi:hypothetical protein FFLO_02184 [Filobasidium floriforme]|uniref:DUF1168-domain-containing protein n=1 Tax=Filobasidium floriforme TaxID=5210 RepID=A0A8K0JNJ4_9TREE|nr:DUF1168-domain-containing protein [Filobasidium floriforme]KAG7562404.1 hypothetical protein FFLO_02184 [Filobasidium floriforme]KAH8088423.1 DUF1168-domain-containing protein [Filobasidium floriforme]
MSTSGPSYRPASGKPGSKNDEDETFKPVNKHMLTPLERQRLQVERLLRDPTKEVHLPKGPREKQLRPPKEMIKNVSGSSAGAGSGEFHVYKQNRRREYERLKLMDEKAKADEEALAFETRQKQRAEAADAKTAKNRAKRLKRKGGGKAGAGQGVGGTIANGSGDVNADGKRRKLASGGITFKRPGEEVSDDDEDEEDEQEVQPRSLNQEERPDIQAGHPSGVKVVETSAIIIRDED